MIVSHSHSGCAMDNPGVLVVFLRPESTEIVKTEPFVHLRAVPYKPTRPRVGAQYSGAAPGEAPGSAPISPGSLRRRDFGTRSLLTGSGRGCEKQSRQSSPRTGSVTGWVTTSTVAGGLQLSMAAVWRHLSVVVIACVLVCTTPETEGANELDAWLWTSADGASD